MKRARSAGAFKMVVGKSAFSSRSTHTMGVVGVGGTTRNAGVVATTPPVGRSGSFTVADNDFSTGWVELFLGDYRLLSGVEYAIGLNVNATAANLAAAISAMPGFTASALGAVVTVVFNDPMGEIDFRAVHRGSHTNFTTFTPSTGYLGGGDPTIGAPVIT